MTLTVGSLFSGIGGLDLGLERAGHKVVWQSEIDPFACKVLQKHWSEVPNHGDIKQIDWKSVEPVDIICGGYPCQPFSQAGKRRGSDDPRHLWRWVREAISELRPRYAILENVRGHLSLGGVQVIGELAEIGYDAEWRVVSAAGLGAPHRRDRIIIVAYPNSSASSDGRQCEDVPSKGRSRGDDGRRSECDTWEVSVGSSRKSTCEVSNDVSEWHGQHRIATDTSTQSRIWRDDRGREDGYVGWQWWEVEPSVGRVAHGIPNRVDRLRGLGNAVVPQVAEYIGRLITTIG